MKSNRTAVKALRSGCGKCSERGLGPCADGIAAAKKKDGGLGSGRAAEGHSGGLPQGLGTDCCGNLCRVAAGASERWRRGVNGTRVAFAGSGRVKNGNRGVKQLSAAGSRGPGDISGRRVSGIARLGWLEGKGGAE